MMDFFDYFQIVSVAIALLIFVGKAAYLRLGRNINPIAICGGKGGLPLAVESLAVAGLIAWVMEVLSYALHSGILLLPSTFEARLIDSVPAKIIGVAVITLGLTLFALAYASFGDSWRVGSDVKTPGALVTTGTFAVSRNPIYVFLDVWFIGIFLINGALIFLILAVLAVAVLHWQILQEESLLLKLYGRPYQNYCARTGRYLVW